MFPGKVLVKIVFVMVVVVAMFNKNEKAFMMLRFKGSIFTWVFLGKKNKGEVLVIWESGNSIYHI